MKTFAILFSLILSINCYSQTPDKPKADNLSIGVSATAILSNLEYPLFYEVGNSEFGYIVSIDDKSQSHFYQANIQYQWENEFYTAVSIGAGIDNINSEIIQFEEWANVGAGGSSWAKRTRTIKIKESRTSIVGSLEAGINFMKSERRFQIGIGMGIDITGYFKPRVIQNEIIKEATGGTTINNPINPTTTSYSETTEHDHQSEERNNYVRSNKWSLISPKIAVTTSFKVSKNLSLFAKTQVRFLIVKDETPTYRSSTQFPISGGIQYHF